MSGPQLFAVTVCGMTTSMTPAPPSTLPSGSDGATLPGDALLSPRGSRSVGGSQGARGSRSLRGSLLAVAAVALTAALAACSPTATAAAPSARELQAVTSAASAAPAASSSSSSAVAPATSARAALDHLVVKGRGPMTGYSRAAFGPAWADTDHNGCDTRNDVLRRDLHPSVLRAGSTCIVASGTLAEPYSGHTEHFVRGGKTSLAVQIDHVVALGNSWVSGAAQWTPAKRLAYANDPLVLLAVDGPLNEAKRDSDAASWLPPNKGYRCAYVARQVAIKGKYGLSVTPAEKDAIARILATCPSQPLPR